MNQKLPSRWVVSGVWEIEAQRVVKNDGKILLIKSKRKKFKKVIKKPQKRGKNCSRLVFYD